MTQDVGLSPGFADPVRAAQACFRALLDATAHPGSVVTLAGPPAPPVPLPSAMASLALTLADAETPIWLDAAAASTSAPAWLRFHCGCRILPTPAGAAFALVAGADALPPLGAFDAGTDEYPDRAATVVIAVEAFAAGVALRLEGPGIDGAATLRVRGLPPRFLAERAANHALFPRGVDVVLVTGALAVALPRSTRISITEG